MSQTHNLDLPTWEEGNTQPDLVFNQLLYIVDALLKTGVEDILAAPPGSLTEGQTWIVDDSATGAWAGHDGEIAQAVTGGWNFIVAQDQWAMRVKSEDATYRFDGSAWSPDGGGTSTQDVAIQVAASDEATIITTGTARVTFRAPYAFTLTSVRASLSTASSSGAPTFDINMNGSTILSTKITIDASEKTSVTAATQPVLSTTAVTDDAEFTIDFDAAGTGAKGVKVTLLGTK